MDPNTPRKPLRPLDYVSLFILIEAADFTLLPDLNVTYHLVVSLMRSKSGGIISAIELLPVSMVSPP